MSFKFCCHHCCIYVLAWLRTSAQDDVALMLTMAAALLCSWGILFSSNLMNLLCERLFAFQHMQLNAASQLYYIQEYWLTHLHMTVLQATTILGADFSNQVRTMSSYDLHADLKCLVCQVPEHPFSLPCMCTHKSDQR